MSDRIAVISEIRLGSHLAHAINVVKTAGGFARAGNRVVLVCRPPSGPVRGAADALSAYAEPNLEILYADDAAGGTAEDFGTWAATAAEGWGATAVYARHFWGAIAAAARRLPVALETHSHPGDCRREVLAAFRSTRCGSMGIRAIVTISESLRSCYIAAGARDSRVHVVPDGVDMDLFRPPAVLPPSPFARWKGPHVVYCGHLYEYKGIPTILGAAQLMPRATFHLVGGTPQDIQATAAQAASLSNVVLHGSVPHRSVPAFLWHADVLLLPPSLKHPSAQWTSPVKLGEYLAAGSAVLASRIPGLEAWVCEPAVRWFEPDDAADMVRGIECSLEQTPSDRPARIAAALAKANSFAYPRRAEAILDAINGRGSPAPRTQNVDHPLQRSLISSRSAREDDSQAWHRARAAG